jgi:hypothetical protein
MDARGKYGTLSGGGPMTKRLIVCCDGTWNNAEAKTHIHWVATHCQTADAEPLPQQVGYFAGVGTDPGLRLSGGTVGVGLSRNVREAYRFIRDRWEPGDELFIFGFSRGAYTARSLGGFLRLVGQLDDSSWVDPAYLWYRLARPPGEPPSRFSGILDVLIRPHIRNEIGVTFLGVFDTVGALGVPFQLQELVTDLDVAGILNHPGLSVLSGLANMFETRLRRPIEGFHDTELGPHIKNAYHALAIDEKRGPFQPTLWTKVPPTSTVEQSWFAGVHGDVGGNYHEEPDGGHLAAVPLLWMMEKATALGLDLVPGALEELRAAADPLGPQHESLTKGWEAAFKFKLGSLDTIVRPIGNAERRRQDPEGKRFPLVEANETIHSSVRRRIGQSVETRHKDGRSGRDAYAPTNVPVVV